jgi:hypothetical protein
MAKAVSLRRLTAEARFRSRFTPSEICDGESGTGTGFSPGTSVFLCQYHSSNAPYSSSSAGYPYHKDKRAKPGNIPKSSSVNLCCDADCVALNAMELGYNVMKVAEYFVLL